MLLAAVGSLYVSPAAAGPLATDPNVYVTGFVFHGSSPLITIDGLATPEGYMDWAVYAPGQRPAGYVGVEADPSYFLYTFQFYNTGPTMVSAIFANADFDWQTQDANVGTFTADGVNGRSPNLIVSDRALWGFSDPILPGESTIGLAYSSPFPPLLSFFGGLVAGEDNFTSAFDGPTPIFPEPSSLTIAALGLIGFAAWGWRRRER